jgi:site-specific recombinase XerC
LTKGEVDSVLALLQAPYRLMASLMYGSGLRLMEWCTLRVKDVDLERGELTVREGMDSKQLLVEALRLPKRSAPHWLARFEPA